MKNMNRQSGMSMWSLMYVVGTLGFFFFLGAKLFSPYMDDFKVSSALESLGKQSDVGTMTTPAIKEAIRKRLEIDSADNFDMSALTVETQAKRKTIRIKYETVVPMAYNVSALLEFDHALEVSSSE